MTSDRLLSKREAAERLSVTEKTIDTWRKKDMLPVRKLPGGAIRVLQSDLDALLSYRAAYGK